MCASSLESQLSVPEALQLANLAEAALTSRGTEQLAQNLLPVVAGLLQSRSVFLYAIDSHLARLCFLHHGLEPDRAAEMEKLGADECRRLMGSNASPTVPDRASGHALYPIADGGSCSGLMGVEAGESVQVSQDVMQRILRIVTNAVRQVSERSESERQLSHLNTYLTVSSALAQSIGLHEVLELSLYSCMEAVSAEAASVLLLDDEKKNLRFYQVGGPASPLLEGATVPSDKGLAGSVLETLQAEMVNDVYKDPRFNQEVDKKSGFQTRNMIAVPLVAGEEKVGVLEVLNKADGQSFTEKESLLLQSIAEEIASAIRNAKIFEYVVNSYCKQRQGENSCRGCKRPLGSWTPCVRYRKAEL